MSKLVCISPKQANIQLVFLGFVSMFVGIVCLVVSGLGYRLDGLTSISESATTGNMLGMILPFALGCMFTYCISYNGYCTSERVIVKVMGVCFALAAMQICASDYGSELRVGLFGLSRQLSDIVHLMGAVTGFGLMWVWIQFYFTRSNHPKCNQTQQKICRNYLYMGCGIAMLCGMLLLIISRFVDMGDQIVFIAEEFILIPAGLAIVVKGGLFLKDKE